MLLLPGYTHRCFSPLVSEGKTGTTLQNLQHLSYQVDLTGANSNDIVSGYSAVMTQGFSTANSGDYIQLVTPNAEVHKTYDLLLSNITYYSLPV